MTFKPATGELFEVTGLTEWRDGAPLARCAGWAQA